MLDAGRAGRPGRRRRHFTYRDTDLSLVDASSFARMERLGIRQAIAFDPPFRQYGPFVVLTHPTDRPPSR